MRRCIFFPLAQIIITAIPSCSSSPCKWTSGEHYYESNGLLDSHYLHLRNDGTFVIHRRDHLTLKEERLGYWGVNQSGLYEFRGAWMRYIVHGPIRIGGYGDDWRQRLPSIKREIEKYLRDNIGERISSDDLEGLAVWRDEVVKENGEKHSYMTVPISIRGDMVEREMVLGAIRAIDEYTSCGDKDVVHARLVTYRGRQFLYWLDGGPMYINMTFDEICNAIDSDDRITLPNSPFYKITGERYGKEIKKGEPFKSHPEPRE